MRPLRSFRRASRAASCFLHGFSVLNKREGRRTIYFRCRSLIALSGGMKLTDCMLTVGKGGDGKERRRRWATTGSGCRTQAALSSRRSALLAHDSQREKEPCRNRNFLCPRLPRRARSCADPMRFGRPCVDPLHRLHLANQALIDFSNRTPYPRPPQGLGFAAAWIRRCDDGNVPHVDPTASGLPISPAVLQRTRAEMNPIPCESYNQHTSSCDIPTSSARSINVMCERRL
jgi:hypothetical protein